MIRESWRGKGGGRFLSVLLFSSSLLIFLLLLLSLLLLRLLLHLEHGKGTKDGRKREGKRGGFATLEKMEREKKGVSERGRGKGRR